jgi:penicillin-binding protein 2
MVGVALSYWFIQVVQHNKFQQLAENNHRRSVSLRAPRGILFDRDGTVLVENRYSFDISIVRELTTDLEYLINKLVAITGIQLRDIQDEIDRHSQLPEYQPIVIIRDGHQFVNQILQVGCQFTDN